MQVNTISVHAPKVPKRSGFFNLLGVSVLAATMAVSCARKQPSYHETLSLYGNKFQATTSEVTRYSFVGKLDNLGPERSTPSGPKCCAFIMFNANTSPEDTLTCTGPIRVPSDTIVRVLNRVYQFDLRLVEWSAGGQNSAESPLFAKIDVVEHRE